MMTNSARDLSPLKQHSGHNRRNQHRSKKKAGLAASEEDQQHPFLLTPRQWANLHRTSTENQPCPRFDFLLHCLQSFDTKASLVGARNVHSMPRWRQATALFKRLVSLLLEIGGQSPQGNFSVYEKRAYLWFCFNQARFIPDQLFRGMRAKGGARGRGPGLEGWVGLGVQS